MEQMNGNELRSVLIEKNLIDEAGTVNAFIVNIISSAHTWPLLSEVWNLYQNSSINYISFALQIIAAKFFFSGLLVIIREIAQKEEE